jgi:hypothetical protein
VSKLIRFDEDHFGYLVDFDIEPDNAKRMSQMFHHSWPDKKLIIMVADEFIDLTGQYEIVPIGDDLAPTSSGQAA